MKTIFCTLFVVAVTVGLAPHSAAEQRVNPFANPKFNPQPKRTVVAGRVEVPPELKLKAVMPAGRIPLANINGETLRIGESYKGYRLQEVHLDQVVLKHQSGTLVLPLRPGMADG